MLRGLEVAIINFSFEENGRYEYPVLTLCNIDRTQMYIMTSVKGLTITPRFNAVSEMSFTIYKEYNGIESDYYEYAKKNRLVYAEGWGYWIIYNIIENNDGGTPSKTLNLYSYEYVLNYKNINLMDGTYKFYDIISPDETLLYKLFQNIPQWKIGHVDTELMNLYRTFEIPEATLYGFLMEEVSESYQAIFLFDTDTLTVNAYAPENIPKETDIVVTFDNMAKNITLEELIDDIVTVLGVNGADNLSINLVNPLGNNKIYTLDYYKTDGWITDQSLIDKINAWEARIEEQREPYADLLQTLKQQNFDLLILQAELATLKSELSALEVVRKNLLPDDKDSPSYDDQMKEFQEKTNEINAKEEEIKNKEAEIEAKQAEKDTTNESLTAINNELKIENYFTTEELVVLSDFLIEQTYTDGNFVVTDDMKTPANLNEDSYVLTTTGLKQVKDLLDTDVLIDEQYIANQLLEQGMKVAKQLAQPSFQFTLDTTNFLFQERFLPFIKQLELGCIINVEIKEGDWAYPLLHEMTIDYDNPTSFSMTFSNRFRLSDEEWTFADLHNETIKTTTQVGTGLQIAKEPVLNGKVNDFEEYMNNTLIAANQAIQSTTDNEISIGSYGLRGRKRDDSQANGYDPHQLWINNNLICMTDDNWQSSKLAIGFINGVYSVNAEVIAGTLLAGSQLTITNDNNSFVVDANGVRIDNASMSITTANNRITLNPDVGIKIESKDGDAWEEKFYVDSDTGSLHFSGTLTAADGIFSGTLQGVDGTFSGTIEAGTINGSTISGTTISGSTIDGNTITGGSIDIGDGNFVVESDGSLTANNAYISGTVAGSTIRGGSISGTSINIGNGNFTVDEDGNCEANSFHGELDGDLQAGTHSIFFGSGSHIQEESGGHIYIYNGEGGSINLGSPNATTYLNGDLDANYADFSGSIDVSNEVRCRNLHVSGILFVGSEQGRDTSVVVGEQTLTFYKGILVDY